MITMREIDDARHALGIEREMLQSLIALHLGTVDAIERVKAAEARVEAMIQEWIAQDCHALANLPGRLVAFITRTWGEKNASNRIERSVRVVEEAIEFAQANGLAETFVKMLTSRVYSRPEGGALNEAAGLGITLVAWCASHGANLDDLLLTEMARIEGMDREKLRQKQREKFAAGFGIDVEEP